jgi:hypothetical protein
MKISTDQVENRVRGIGVTPVYSTLLERYLKKRRREQFSSTSVFSSCLQNITETPTVKKEEAESPL